MQANTTQIKGRTVLAHADGEPVRYINPQQAYAKAAELGWKVWRGMGRPYYVVPAQH